MPTFDEVAEFVREQTGYCGPLTKSISLQSDIGVYGDDMSDLLTAYSDRFGISMSCYIWYFHTGEEGINIGGLFVAPPDRRVSEIPITVGMLQEFATLGRWDVSYPHHEVPQSRHDIRINQVIAGAFLVLLVVLVALWLIVV